MSRQVDVEELQYSVFKASFGAKTCSLSAMILYSWLVSSLGFSLEAQRGEDRESASLQVGLLESEGWVPSSWVGWGIPGVRIVVQGGFLPHPVLEPA